MADSRYTKNNASTGQVWSEAYADNLDNQLDILSKRVWYVDDQVWIISNAQYNGSAWERIDTAKPAWGICLDASGNLATINLVAAGSNPIAGPDMTVSIDSSGNLTAPTLSSVTSLIGGILALTPAATIQKTVRDSTDYLSGTSYQEVCAQAVPIQYRAATLRLYSEFFTGAEGTTLDAQWKKNGSVVASQSFSGSTSTYPWSVDLAYAPGDEFSLETKIDTAGLYQVLLVEVRGDEILPTAGYVPWA